MIFNKPDTIDEFLDIVDQAIFEIDEILLCAEDEDSTDYQLSAMVRIYEALATELKTLHEDAKKDQRNFADGADLSFIPIAEKARNFIPFVDLLDMLNRAHTEGLRN